MLSQEPYADNKQSDQTLEAKRKNAEAISPTLAVLWLRQGGGDVSSRDLRPLLFQNHDTGVSDIYARYTWIKEKIM